MNSLDPTYQILCRSYFNNLTQKESNKLVYADLIKQASTLVSTSNIREDYVIMVGLSNIYLQNARSLKSDIREQYQSLFKRERMNPDDTKKKVRHEDQTRSTRKRVIPGPVLLCIDSDDSQSQILMNSRNLASNKDLTLSSQDISQYHEHVDLMTLVDHRYQTPPRSVNIEEQIGQVQLSQVQEKLRQRRIHFVFPPSNHQELRENFTKLMRYTFEDNHNVDEIKTKRQNHPRNNTHACPTVDKHTIYGRNIRDEPIRFNTSYNLANEQSTSSIDTVSQLHEIEIKRSIFIRMNKNIQYEDSIDRILFEFGNKDEALSEEVNKILENSQLPSYWGSGNSYTQFQQFSEDIQVARDDSEEMSIQSDRLQINHIQQKRSDGRKLGSNLRVSILDEIIPHQLQTIKETLSHTRLDSRSKVNISMKLHDRCGSDKASAFYELLIKVSKDKRYILFQDSTETFGDIECVFQPNGFN